MSENNMGIIVKRNRPVIQGAMKRYPYRFCRLSSEDRLGFTLSGCAIWQPPSQLQFQATTHSFIVHGSMKASRYVGYAVVRFDILISLFK